MSQTKGKNKEQFIKVAHHLKQISENTKRNSPITFGVIYTAPYAVHVHEDLETPHRIGQAKFLEQPLKQEAKTLTKIVKDNLKQGKTLKQALLEAGNWLLYLSRQLVPVNTGTLRDSGIVKIV